MYQCILFKLVKYMTKKIPNLFLSEFSNNQQKINPTRDFINKLIRREKYLHLFVTESTIDHANLYMEQNISRI